MKPLFFEVEPGTWVNLNRVTWATVHSNGDRFWVSFGSDEDALTIRGEKASELWERLQARLRSLSTEDQL